MLTPGFGPGGVAPVAPEGLELALDGGLAGGEPAGGGAGMVATSISARAKLVAGMYDGRSGPLRRKSLRRPTCSFASSYLPLNRQFTIALLYRFSIIDGVLGSPGPNISRSPRSRSDARFFSQPSRISLAAEQTRLTSK